MNCTEATTSVVPVSDPPDLFESGIYKTPVAPTSFLKQLATRNRLYFYTKFLRVVAHGAKMAKRGSYTRQSWFDLSRNLMKMIEAQGGRFEITGFENLHKHEGPVVFVSNHMSMLETAVFPCLLLKQGDLCVTLKKQLTELPLFGTMTTGFRNVAVTRDKPMEDYKKIIREGGAALDEGYSILIFPQSTRTVDFKPEEFNTVGVKLAHKAGVPVVPVALKTDFWKPGRLIKDMGPFDRSIPIHFAFGEPVEIVSRNGKVENGAIIDFIQSRLREWGTTVSDDRQPSGS